VDLVVAHCYLGHFKKICIIIIIIITARSWSATRSGNLVSSQSENGTENAVNKQLFSEIKSAAYDHLHNKYLLRLSYGNSLGTTMLYQKQKSKVSR